LSHNYGYNYVDMKTTYNHYFADATDEDCSKRGIFGHTLTGYDFASMRNPGRCDVR